MPKISQLETAPILPLVGNEPFVVVQNGVTVKAPVDQIPINLSFPTIAALQAASPPAAEDSVYVEGYYSSGDGGGHWRTRGTGAGEITDAAGDTWIVSSDNLDIRMFGGVIDASDNRDYIISALLFSDGREISFPSGNWANAGAAITAPDNSRIYLCAGATLSGSEITNCKKFYELRNETPVSGSILAVQKYWKDSDTPSNDMIYEGSLWAGADGYVGYGFHKQFDIGVVPNPGNAPLCTQYTLAQNMNVSGEVVAQMTVATTYHTTLGPIGGVFGQNIIVRSDSSVTDCKLVGLEVDVTPHANTTLHDSAGLILNIFGGAPTNAHAGLIGGFNSATWAFGFVSSEITGPHYCVSSSNTATSSSFIDSRNGTYSNAAIWLGNTIGHGLKFGGPSFGASSYIYTAANNNLSFKLGGTGVGAFYDSATGTQSLLTIQDSGALNLPIGHMQVAGTKVVGARETGWTVPTGTVQRTGYATYTAPAISNPPTQAEVQAIANALQSVSRTLAALIADLDATNGHGLIGS